MGNNQSTSDRSCPSSRLCRVFYLGMGPSSSEDSDEWFGVLPRERKQKKKSYTQRNLTVMPVVPEETIAGTSNFDEESVGGVGTSPNDDDLSCASPESIKEFNKLSLTRQSSHPVSAMLRGMKSKAKSKVKLTFVNGQFVDMSTLEGQDLVNAALSEENGTSIAVSGILSSVKSGHCDKLGLSESRRSSFSQALSSITASSFISKSDSSIDSSTFNDYSASSNKDTSSDYKAAVSSIVALGKGYLLTSSNFDRVIKMWKLTSVGGKTTPLICRVFQGRSTSCGRSTGITCIEKVDKKGRFLSASKDCIVKLWDSKFSCDDDSGDGDDRVLLATFGKIEKRAIRGIAIIEDGKYVRPTDKIDATMTVSMVRKSIVEGSTSVQKAAKERQIIECSCEFATITQKSKRVKLWCVTTCPEKEGGNVADVMMMHELKHDAVVQSITSMRGKGIILTGDSNGHVKLWKSWRNVFLPDSSSVWTCARTFSWRKKSDIFGIQDNYQACITSLTILQGNMFVSGSRSGILRVWKLDGTKIDGETITKEDICINGAHNSTVTSVQQIRSKDSNVSFASASEDGKVLSFTIPNNGSLLGRPRCFSVVNHGITNRYFPDADRVGVVALCCLSISPDNLEDILVSGTSNSDGYFHVLRPPVQNMQEDALILYRQSILEESLTILEAAERIHNIMKCKSRKSYLLTYPDCFLGSDAVSYLVENRYAASRKDAVDLGRVLASHLSLFECVSKKSKLLVDDAKSYYRFSEEFKGASVLRRATSEGGSLRSSSLK